MEPIGTLLIACALARVQDAPAKTVPSRVLHIHRAADDALVNGHYDVADREFQRALELAPSSATLAYGMACVSARMERPEEALRWLEIAFGWGYRDAAVARWDADLSAIRQDTRYDTRFESILVGAVPEPESRELWNVAGQPKVRMPIRQGPLGEHVALGWGDGRIQIVDATSGRLDQEWDGGAGPPRAFAFSPPGDVLACMHADGTLTRWDVTSGERLSATAIDLAKPMGYWARLDYVASGERIIGHWSASGLLWTAEGKQVARLPLTGYPDTMAWSARGTRFALMSAASVAFRDVATGAPVGSAVSVVHGCHGLALSPDGTKLGVGSTGGRVLLFDVQTREPLWEAIATDDATGTGIDSLGDPLTVPTVTFSPTGDALAVCTASGFFIHVFDAQAGELRWRSGHLGGRMGAAMPLSFGEHHVIADWGSFFFDAATGDRRDVQPATWGNVDIGPTGKALIQCGPGYGWFDERTGTALYHRIEITRDGMLLLHGSGWFAGTVTRPNSIRVQRGARRNAPSRPLDGAWFDPKRLRAAQAGVRLTSSPVKTERRR